jgi:hypothetical protein
VSKKKAVDPALAHGLIEKALREIYAGGTQVLASELQMGAVRQGRTAKSLPLMDPLLYW